MVSNKNTIEQLGHPQSNFTSYQSEKRPIDFMYGARSGLVEQVIKNDPLIPSDIQNLLIKWEDPLFFPGISIQKAKAYLNSENPRLIFEGAARKLLEYANIILKDKPNIEQVKNYEDLRDVEPFFKRAVDKSSTGSADQQDFRLITKHLRSVWRVLIETRIRPN